MKALTSLLHPLASLVVLLLPLTLSAQEPNDHGPGGQGPAHSPLHDQMESINRNLRKLNRQYADPAQKTSSLEIVAELQKSADAAKTLYPEKVEKMPQADKTKFLALFAKDMDALAKELTALKAAVESGNAAETKKELDALNQLKSTSHKELGVKDEHRGGPGGGPGGRGGPGGPGGPGGWPHPGDANAPGGPKAPPPGSQPAPAASPAPQS